MDEAIENTMDTMDKMDKCVICLQLFTEEDEVTVSCCQIKTHPLCLASYRMIKGNSHCMICQRQKKINRRFEIVEVNADDSDADDCDEDDEDDEDEDEGKEDDQTDDEDSEEDNEDNGENDED